MRTSELVSLIHDEAPDYGRPLILAYLNEAQRLMLNHPLNGIVAYDLTTGKYPILVTQDGVFSYSIGLDSGFPTDAWRVVALMSSMTDTAGISFIQHDDTGVGATVIFNENPGVKSLYVKYYAQPIALTSEKIGLTVPGSFHLLLKRITMLMLEEAEHGAPSQDLELIRRRELPKFWQQMNVLPVERMIATGYR